MMKNMPDVLAKCRLNVIEDGMLAFAETSNAWKIDYINMIPGRSRVSIRIIFFSNYVPFCNN